MSAAHINPEDLELVTEAIDTAQSHPNWPRRCPAKVALARLLMAAKREGQDDVLSYLDGQDPGLDNGWCQSYARWFREQREAPRGEKV